MVWGEREGGGGYIRDKFSFVSFKHQKNYFYELIFAFKHSYLDFLHCFLWKKMTSYDDEIFKEAEILFKHSTVDFLTKNEPSYNISQTYKWFYYFFFLFFRIENIREDPLKLIEGLSVTQEYETYLQPIFCPENGELLTYEERWIDDANREGNAQNSMSIKRFRILTNLLKY